jgi:hypothetical protein
VPLKLRATGLEAPVYFLKSTSSLAMRSCVRCDAVMKLGHTASSTTASFGSTGGGGGGRHTAGLLCLFAPAHQPQAFTINPRLYLYVTCLAQHLAPHLRLNVVFPLCVGHKEHLRPKSSALCLGRNHD